MTQVKLYANLRNLAGTKELSITGATIGAVLTELFKRNPPLGDVILENGKIRPHFVVMLNGHNMIDLNMQVAEQDVIAIFPPIAGG
jgi:sulfur-carrier protein